VQVDVVLAEQTFLQVHLVAGDAQPRGPRLQKPVQHDQDAETGGGQQQRRREIAHSGDLFAEHQQKHHGRDDQQKHEKVSQRVIPEHGRVGIVVGLCIVRHRTPP